MPITTHAHVPDRIENNPPADPPLGDIWRVRFYGFQENQMTVNNFFYEDDLDAPGTGTIDTAGELLGAVRGIGGLQELYGKALCQSWLWDHITIDCPTTPHLATQSVAVQGTGSNHQTLSPSFTSAVLQKHTTLKGKAGRGWIGLPAVPIEAFLFSELVDLVPYQNFANVMMQRLTSGTVGFTPVVFSHGIKGSGKFGSSIITQVTVRKKLGTIRRRMLGRGK
jgi:hypothetical protein